MGARDRLEQIGAISYWGFLGYGATNLALNLGTTAWNYIFNKPSQHFVNFLPYGNEVGELAIISLFAYMAAVYAKEKM